MKQLKIYSPLVWIFSLILALASCSKDNGLGIEILPKDDLISVFNVVMQDQLSGFTFSEDSIRTDESSQSLFGSFNDPVFGNTTINYAAQFRLQAYPDFGINPTVDSVHLVMRYRRIYGDTITPQRIKVYELDQSIDIDQEYKQDVDLKSYASGTMLGEFEFTPTRSTDTTGTIVFQQSLRIPLDNSLGQKIADADSSQLINNDVFLELFKGLYIESERLDGTGGAIVTLEEITGSNYFGSGIQIFYHNEGGSGGEEADTTIVPILISEFSARVNSIDHDYTGTSFVDKLNQENEEDSLIYVQATGGLKSRILIGELLNWQDSLNTAINKAELVFQIDTIASDLSNYAPPAQLLFTIVDEEGKEFLPIDYVFNPDYYGGRLLEDLTYRFNVTQHIQEVIDGNAENLGFFLTTANKNNEASRVVIKGPRSTTGVKLIITYSKFNN